MKLILHIHLYRMPTHISIKASGIMAMATAEQEKFVCEWILCLYGRCLNKLYPVSAYSAASEVVDVVASTIFLFSFHQFFVFFVLMVWPSANRTSHSCHISRYSNVCLIELRNHSKNSNHIIKRKFHVSAFDNIYSMKIPLKYPVTSNPKWKFKFVLD